MGGEKELIMSRFNHDFFIILSRAKSIESRKKILVRFSQMVNRGMLDQLSALQKKALTYLQSDHAAKNPKMAAAMLGVFQYNDFSGLHLQAKEGKVLLRGFLRAIREGHIFGSASYASPKNSDLSGFVKQDGSFNAVQKTAVDYLRSEHATKHQDITEQMLSILARGDLKDVRDDMRIELGVYFRDLLTDHQQTQASVEVDDVSIEGDAVLSAVNKAIAKLSNKANLTAEELGLALSSLGDALARQYDDLDALWDSDLNELQRAIIASLYYDDEDFASFQISDVAFANPNATLEALKALRDGHLSEVNMKALDKDWSNILVSSVQGNDTPEQEELVDTDQVLPPQKPKAKAINHKHIDQWIKKLNALSAEKVGADSKAIEKQNKAVQDIAERCLQALGQQKVLSGVQNVVWKHFSEELAKKGPLGLKTTLTLLNVLKSGDLNALDLDALAADINPDSALFNALIKSKDVPLGLLIALGERFDEEHQESFRYLKAIDKLMNGPLKQKGSDIRKIISKQAIAKLKQKGENVTKGSGRTVFLRFLGQKYPEAFGQSKKGKKTLLALHQDADHMKSELNKLCEVYAGMIKRVGLKGSSLIPNEAQNRLLRRMKLRLRQYKGMNDHILKNGNDVQKAMYYEILGLSSVEDPRSFLAATELLGGKNLQSIDIASIGSAPFLLNALAVNAPDIFADKLSQLLDSKKGIVPGKVKKLAVAFAKGLVIKRDDTLRTTIKDCLLKHKGNLSRAELRLAVKILKSGALSFQEAEGLPVRGKLYQAIAKANGFSKKPQAFSDFQKACQTIDLIKKSQQSAANELGFDAKMIAMQKVWKVTEPYLKKMRLSTKGLNSTQHEVYKLHKSGDINSVNWYRVDRTCAIFKALKKAFPDAIKAFESKSKDTALSPRREPPECSPVSSPNGAKQPPSQEKHIGRLAKGQSVITFRKGSRTMD